MDGISQGSVWRRRVAEKIGPIYAESPKVAGVVLGGSTARGHADRYSDIEMGVFWHKPPTEEERRHAGQQASANFRLYPYEPAEEVWADDLMVGRSKPEDAQSGVLVEVVHYTTETMERTLQSVLRDYDPDLGKQNLISGIVDGIPLAGKPVIQEWKRTASQYPDGLAKAMIERYGVIDHFWRWQMLLERGENRMLLYQMYSQVEQQILEMLLAVNHIYYFGFKWSELLIQKLVLAPENLGERLKEPYKAAPVDGAKMLSGLVEETYDLIEQRMPAINVDRLRGFFRYQRPFLEDAPQLI